MVEAELVLHLLAGLPCSGKTTYARELEAAGAIRVSVDEMIIAEHGRLGVDYEPAEHLGLLGPIVERARAIVGETLQRGSSVVLDHGLGLRSERDDWKQLASSQRARWRLVRFDADLATLRARCLLRSAAPGAIRITEDTLQFLASTWEPPRDEGESCVDSTADWAQDFYSMTDRWWGPASSVVDQTDRARAGWLKELADADGQSRGSSVLELGCGSGSTAAAVAEAGFEVIGIDFSDRVHRAVATAATFVNDDFYEHQFDERFDTVTYWDGFGVGTDSDHLRLLNRIATDLAQPNGLVVIEVFDPTGWESDDGLLETKFADPGRGYHYTLDHARTFDATSRRAIDAWRDHDDDRVWSQSLRCYSPAEFTALVTTSKLDLERITELGRSDWSYLAVLRVSPGGVG